MSLESSTNNYRAVEVYKAVEASEASFMQAAVEQLAAPSATLLRPDERADRSLHESMLADIDAIKGFSSWSRVLLTPYPGSVAVNGGETIRIEVKPDRNLETGSRSASYNFRLDDNRKLDCRLLIAEGTSTKFMNTTPSGTETIMGLWYPARALKLGLLAVGLGAKRPKAASVEIPELS